jgi:sugar phosphate isomerase/epimerase
VRAVVDAVQPKRAKFSLEMMQWTFPDSVDNYLDLIKAIGRDMFGVHLDPVNLIITPRQYFDTGTLIRECFDKLGQWVISCHAKDIILRNKLSLHLDETMPGTGNLDYAAYLSELAKLPPDTPLMLEHLTTMEDYAKARDFVVGAAKSAGAL